MSRYKIEKFLHLPMFKKLVQNCFVRIGIGQHQGLSVYRAAEIVDVVETAKVYSVGSNRTNVGLRLKFGKEERVFRIEFISNQRIAPKEFQKWKEACEKANMTLPTLDFIKSKSSEIKKAVNYNYTSEDVEKIVQMKERFKKNPVNYAMAKARMMKEKEIALANGEEERAHELESKLNAIEERAEELDKKRSGSISTIGLINDRNRKKNVEKAEAAIMEEIEYKKKHGVEDNPFTRRWSNPKMVSFA